MKKVILILVIMLAGEQNKLFSQTMSDTSFFLITCGPGIETYSHYGHSALRVTIPSQNIDLVYNWGVFDFSTPNFAYKFAKGRLEYMLDTETLNQFLRAYLFEQRWVEIQKINLSPSETKILMQLIAENLKPENVKYRYDFFYDDCSTRIRDLLEKATDNKLLYSPSAEKYKPTFRFLTGTYQLQYPWLDFGIDLLMGTPSDKKASDREKMFLPIELQKGLSEAYVNRNGRMVPLLQNPETVLDYPDPVVKQSFVTQPFFIFTLLCVAIIIFTAMVRSRRTAKIADILIYALFSLLALLMLFTNFITDHEQMKYNLCLLWLSPFVPVCLAAVILNKEWIVWFRIVFILSLVSFIIQIVSPYTGNNAFMPLILILLVRSSVRASFTWNPLSAKTF
jgi:hypothetical protein